MWDKLSDTCRTGEAEIKGRRDRVAIVVCLILSRRLAVPSFQPPLLIRLMNLLKETLEVKTTRTFVSFLSVILLAGLPVLSHADNHSPAPPGVLETWACTYNPGQDQDDLT